MRERKGITSTVRFEESSDSKSYCISSKWELQSGSRQWFMIGLQFSSEWWFTIKKEKRIKILELTRRTAYFGSVLIEMAVTIKVIVMMEMVVHDRAMINGGSDGGYGQGNSYDGNGSSCTGSNIPWLFYVESSSVFVKIRNSVGITTKIMRKLMDQD
ncbi:unnamed protein product [Rhizophagus irregularis]|nr:unnamed protein product [Rhizophagus irregularis]